MQSKQKRRPFSAWIMRLISLKDVLLCHSWRKPLGTLNWSLLSSLMALSLWLQSLPLFLSMRHCVNPTQFIHLPSAYCLSLHVSVSLSFRRHIIHVPVSLGVSFSVCIHLILYMHIWFCVCTSVCLRVCVCLYVFCPYVCLSVCRSTCTSVCLYVCLPLGVAAYVCVSLLFCLSST